MCVRQRATVHWHANLRHHPWCRWYGFRRDVPVKCDSEALRNRVGWRLSIRCCFVRPAIKIGSRQLDESSSVR
jgi:hypothetical protein